MTIPSTPAKGKTWPVRYVGVLRQASEVGSYHTTNAVSDRYLLGDMRHYDIYTLLPPHLAKQWAELRKVKDAAEADLDHQLTVHGSASSDGAFVEAWRSATDALATFEATHGIGGGA